MNQPKKIIKMCAECKTLFQAPLYRLKKGHGRFCSRECLGFSLSGKRGVEPEKRYKLID